MNDAVSEVISIVSSMLNNASSIIYYGVIIACYVLQAIGYYQLSKRRGYQHPWLACIPVLQIYVFGWIADDINKLSGKKTAYRILLIVLGVAYQLFAPVAIIIMLFSGVALLILGIGSYGNYQGQPQVLVGLAVALIVSLALISLLSTAFVVVRFIALNTIYRDYSPKEAVLFLLLSIFISPAYSIIIFLIREKPANSICSNLYEWYPQNTVPPWRP